MKILDISYIPGPNVFANRAIMAMRLDLEDLADVESKDQPGFVERLVQLLPGLKTHRCSRGHEGGFVERLVEGTYFGHIVEHVALELSGPAGVEAFYGKTVYDGAPGIYRVVVECELEALTRMLLESAVELVQAVFRDEEFRLDERIAAARETVSRTALGPSTRAIVDAAQRRNIPCRRLNEDSLVQLGYGKHRQLIQATQTWNTRSVSAEIASDKALTKALLAEACVPVPWGRVVRSAAEAVAAQASCGSAVAIKPLDGHHGQGVSLNVATKDEVEKAFTLAREYSRRVVVEEMFAGRDYRLVVVGGRLVAASERRPPRVVGDGKSTVACLVETENRNPARGDGHEKPMTKIPLDETALASLAKQGLALDAIPGAGVEVWLREGANLSTGGSAIDVTDFVHSTTRAVCERAAQAVGLDVCGIDLMAADISRRLQRGEGVIEVNAAPGIRMHHFPAEGVARDVADAIVAMLYPQKAEGRIPIVSVTGTNGKTTTTRLISHVLRHTGLCVGTTTTGGIWIDDDMIADGDTTGPRSARTVLADPRVEIAVLETARGGMTRHGLGYDWSDVGVITNIQTDHIGQDGIESEDDLLRIKSLVAERVREGGTLVLNAADERLASLPSQPRLAKIERKVSFFARDPAHGVIRSHRSAGGRAYYEKRGWLVEANGSKETFLAPLASLPVTMGGSAAFQIENVLAAVAACRGVGLEADQIVAALQTFSSDKSNPGRLNLYRVGHCNILIDYGHNPAAFSAVAATVKQWGGRVTGVIAVPGDRCDSVLRQAACAAAAGFDRIFVKEDRDRRGRDVGAAASLIAQTIMEERPGIACAVVLDEIDALNQALETAETRETIVVFYDDLEPLEAFLRDLDAEPIAWHEFADEVDDDEVASDGRAPSQDFAEDAALVASGRSEY